ncbi:MAG: hypothetical protein MUO82_04570 [Candidatus Thermoplasmatota archaeon]|nr:hypothetical protein [Candidatus Thermoplasmatota archaeon]
MVCPLFVDFTRMCLKKFPVLVKFTTLQTCDSDQYADCPVYLLCNSNFNCKYLPSCSKQYHEKSPELVQDIFDKKDASEALKNIWTNYCLSPENSKTCAKYQLYSKREIPPLELQPDGSITNPSDFLNKRKHIIHPPK